MKIVLALLLLVLPWRLRRLVLQACFGYDLDPQSSVGFSIVLAKKVVLKDRSRIGHLTVIRGLDELRLSTNSRIGNLNWITGFPSSADGSGRRSALLIEEHAAITHRHLLDCSDSVVIGKFSTVAGWNSQFITHSIDLNIARQTAKPIRIGKYCFVGSRSILVKGAELPDYSVLAAGGVLTEKFTESYCIYGGVPARKVGELPEEAKYFGRNVGYIN
ncbi:acyltransferase [Bradyrhizobium sp. 138]|uniref:acyltransferase n=1 Tax=Bradyrhizobium sp. 138 TaxID=2782615 RepID=UPI001FF948EE|nr:DapH/DapD/GlmU-related protein [Bradyrhizobium sp. 138]MCK1735272.1 acyltransferase [Bradyrhizobium sp. 138]